MHKHGVNIIDYEIEFTICEWLDRRTFDSITKIATYIGRRNNCSVFKLVKYKVSNASDSDVQEFMKTLLGLIGDSEYNLVEEAINILRGKYAIIAAHEKGYALKSPILLLNYLADFRREGLVRYSREDKAYLVQPHVIVDVVNRLLQSGFQVLDKTGLIEIDKTRLNYLEFLGKLRDYQQEALEQWMKNNYRGVIALPTGAGKTVVAIAAITVLKARTLVITYTREQMNEWFEKVRKYTNVSLNDIGLYFSDSKTIRPITITTYHSAVRNINLFREVFQFIIVDEAHHLPAASFRKIAQNMLSPYRMGLSATPYRDDGLHELLFRLMGGLVYSLGPHELLQRGFLAPYKIVPLGINAHRGEIKEYRELLRRIRLLAGNATIDELRERAANDEKSKEALSLMSKLRRLLACMSSKKEIVDRIVKNELSKSSKIIVFVEYVDCAEELAKKLNAGLLVGKMDPTERKRVLEEFKNSSVGVLVVTSVGDEGIDIPDANVGIVLSPSMSRRQLLQRLGRLLRPRLNKEARMYILYLRNSIEEAKVKRLLREVQ